MVHCAGLYFVTGVDYGICKGRVFLNTVNFINDYSSEFMDFKIPGIMDAALCSE